MSGLDCCRAENQALTPLGKKLRYAYDESGERGKTPQKVDHCDWMGPEVGDLEGGGRGIAAEQVIRSMTPDSALRA